MIMYPRANVYIDVENIGKPMVSRSEKDLQMVGKTNIYCMLVYIKVFGIYKKWGLEMSMYH